MAHAQFERHMRESPSLRGTIGLLAIGLACGASFLAAQTPDSPEATRLIRSAEDRGFAYPQQPLNDFSNALGGTPKRVCVEAAENARSGEFMIGNLLPQAIQFLSGATARKVWLSPLHLQAFDRYGWPGPMTLTVEVTRLESRAPTKKITTSAFVRARGQFSFWPKIGRAHV